MCLLISCALSHGDWPYDLRDDPSFFSARRFGTPITWGICRRDLRGVLEPGDTVAFIAHRKYPNGLVDYRWTGFATVAQKIKQTEIWEDQDYAMYRQYLNLLIRPNVDGGYVHWEGHPGEPHPDWLWRLTRSKGHRWQAKDFAAYLDSTFTKTFLPGRDRAANGELIRLSPNYVIFSIDGAETVTLAQPPVVAVHRPEWGPQQPERWLETSLAQTLRRMTLGASGNARTLRLTTPDPARKRLQQRHRHIKLPIHSVDAAHWRSEANQMLLEQGLQVCPSHL